MRGTSSQGEQRQIDTTIVQQSSVNKYDVARRTVVERVCSYRSLSPSTSSPAHPQQHESSVCADSSSSYYIEEIYYWFDVLVPGCSINSTGTALYFVDIYYLLRTTAVRRSTRIFFR